MWSSIKYQTCNKISRKSYRMKKVRVETSISFWEESKPNNAHYTNCYPSVFRNWLRQRCYFGIEHHFAGPQSCDGRALGDKLLTEIIYPAPYLKEIAKMHIPSSDVYSQLQVERAGIWFVPTIGDDTHAILLKSPSNILKALIKGASIKLGFSLKDTPSGKVLMSVIKNLAEF